jgi:hypothetical protein
MKMRIFAYFTLFTDLGFYDRYLISLLESQHEEKVSILFVDYPFSFLSSP